MSETGSILLIDDSEAIRELVLAYCSGHLDVRAVSSESEALVALQEQPYDLVLLDIELQGSDGFTVLKSLKKNLALAGLPRPPVLALSAHDGSEFIAELIQAGFSGRIKKPFQKKYLLQVLANHLLRRRDRDS
ncbi:MAG TPA: hypothetical protein DEA96_10980 [Leptospiraceae bacterium]|nr:hypothetical protein [Spirochaetaceae bacterium]HBS05482.1 hypothetical protein [Leptospiraceae bacterium]|tara:strand:+ start:13821 stop:14219 length:399 start_codon:yes stop_codon:yes gene_type:complete